MFGGFVFLSYLCGMNQITMSILTQRELFLIALFALVTSPVIANRVGNVAYMEALAQEAAAHDRETENDAETEKEEEGDRT